MRISARGAIALRRFAQMVWQRVAARPAVFISAGLLILMATNLFAAVWRKTITNEFRL